MKNWQHSIIIFITLVFYFTSSEWLKTSINYYHQFYFFLFPFIENGSLLSLDPDVDLFQVVVPMDMKLFQDMAPGEEDG